MLLRLRDWLSAELGLPIPGVRIAATEAGARRVDVVVRGLTVARLDLPAPWATPLSSSEVEERTGSPAVAVGPLVDTWWTWITHEQHQVLADSYEPTLDVRGIVCHVLAELLPRHASAMLEAETVIQRFGSDFPSDDFLTDDLPQVLREARAQLEAGTPLSTDPTGPTL